MYKNLTVVIPIYLISDELVELTNTCLASVRTYLPGATIILVDDGSTHIPANCINVEEATILTQKENLGMATAINTGIFKRAKDAICPRPKALHL